jgi:pyridoxal 5-phosphate dependent beta-lyase
VNVRAGWKAARTASTYLHLDSGAAGRTSTASQRAVAAHATAESERGAYVAQAAATDVLASLRADLGGLLGVGRDDVGFVESASTALGQLLASWRLSAGEVVACAPSEWGPNLRAFRDQGLRVVHLPVDDAGTVDVEALPGYLDRVRPALVHLTVAAAHRALVQPAQAVVAVCRPRELPVLCDLAQALGHVPVHHIGADAVYGTGRKWLAGPRGVGFLAVRPDTGVQLRPVWPALGAADWPGETPVARRLESREGHVAGRVGLAQAVREHLDLGPGALHAELAAVGRGTRWALADLPGWTVCDQLDAPGAVTTLLPPPGLTAAEARTRLLTEHAIVTTAVGVERAPGEMTQPTLRLTPHVDTGIEELLRLHDALAAL